MDEDDRRQDRILFLKGRPVAGRVIEPAPTLREALLRLFQRQTAPYAFYESNLLGGAEDRLNGRVDPWALIAEALRASVRQDVVDAVVTRVGSSRLRVSANIDFTRFELKNDERAAIDLLLADPISVEDLARSGLMSAEGCKRLVYMLLITKSVAPYDPAAVSGATGVLSAQPQPYTQAPAISSPQVIEQEAPAGRGGLQSKSPAARLERLADLPAPPSELSPELHERWTKIVARARLIENQNYFEMLGLDKKGAGP